MKFCLIKGLKISALQTHTIYRQTIVNIIMSTNNSVNSTNCNPSEKPQWFLFLSSSVLTFVSGLFLILLNRLLYFLFFNYKKHTVTVPRDPQYEQGCTNQEKINKVSVHFQMKSRECTRLNTIRHWAAKHISGKHLFGRLLLMLQFVFSLISICIYIYETTVYIGYVERCISWTQDRIAQIDFACNLFFFVHFWILFVAASDRLSYWLKLYSFVEYATLPPVFMTLFLQNSWIGLKFMRTLKIMTLPDVLLCFGIVRTSSNIRLLQLSTIFFTMWTCGAGFYHLLENTGDLWLDEFNGEYNSYGVILYYTVVTMSTVGYGDIYPKTSLGKLFVSIYILGALAIFASYVPEIASILLSKSKYSGSFIKESDRKHIIVCGNMNSESVDNFLADFLHKDRELTDVTIVLVNRQKPDLEMEALLKRNFTQVVYFEGSVLNVADCERVCMNCADAVIVIADKHCIDPEAEDSANIMRVVSIKIFSPKRRVIVQLLQYSSKALLLNIPFWDSKNGDEVICLAELKLGFLAQNCLVPGFSTVMANLFAVRNFKMNSKKKRNDWMTQYERGAAMEIYDEYFSKYFHGMNFNDAVKICFEKLHIILLAVVTRCDKSKQYYLVINPGKKVIISKWSQGYFIANSQNEVSRVYYYCYDCHVNTAAQNITQCACINKEYDVIERRRSSTKIRLSTKSRNTHNNDEEIVSSTFLSTMKKETELLIQVDSTGMFHWCPERPMEDVTLTYKEASKRQFKNHIVVCIFSEKKSPLIGLRNFVMPLRASNFRAHQLKEIVFIGDVDFMRSEWHTIQNFPHISILPGSPMNRAVLRSVRVNKCDMCVILSAKISSGNVDPYLIDKEVILCSLNIKSMQFDEPAAVSPPKTDNRKDSTDPSLNSKNSTQIPMITELVVDSNIQFLDQDEKDDNNVDLFLTSPFVMGSVFTVSVLDSLISTAYFNHNAMTLIRDLVTGGATPEFERIVTEGAQIEGGEISADKASIRRRSRIQKISFRKGKFLNFANAPFGQLFVYALDRYGIMCLGIYRIRDDIGEKSNESIAKRYVITNPAADCQLKMTDFVYGLHPYDEDGSTTESM